GLALWRRRARKRQTREALAYADAHLHAWALRAQPPRASLARRTAEALLWLLVAAALAGPRQLLALDAAGATRAQHRVNVMVVLRLPARDADTLAASRMALHELQRRLQGERLGLVVYRAGAGLLLPCTDDPGLFDDFLDRAGPALLGDTRGDGLPAALWLARRELARESGASRAVLLLTGAGTSPEDPSGAAGPRSLKREARGFEAAHLPLFLLWTGPGEIDPALRALARRSGGASAELGSPQAWTQLYRRGIARLPSNPAPPGSQPVWRELYALPLAAALLLLVWLQVPARRRARATIPPALLLIAALGLAGTPAMLPRAQAGEAPARQARAWAAWQAWQAWSRHDYAACTRLYAGLPGFDARLGEGDCAYRAGRWPQAEAAFRRAMLGAPDDARRALALYNLGNAAFHLQGGLREALDAYRASLVLRPGDPAAVRNLRLAQAQWVQEHPEQAMAAMRKRGTPQGAGRFGDTADTTPSSMAARRKARQAQGYEDPRLQAGGRLQASGELAGPEGPGLALDPAELQAARHAVPWLHDHRGALLRALVRQDSGEAAERPQGP
ncbi:MAG: tetratricopeptide repeat protein, partial [Betaproteobacteria bacterium]|nr:tetratricopeptide repeat protein [Betaproteobacteria bacterium]